MPPMNSVDDDPVAKIAAQIARLGKANRRNFERVDRQLEDLRRTIGYVAENMVLHDTGHYTAPPAPAPLPPRGDDTGQHPTIPDWGIDGTGIRVGWKILATRLLPWILTTGLTILFGAHLRWGHPQSQAQPTELQQHGGGTP